MTTAALSSKQHPDLAKLEGEVVASLVARQSRTKDGSLSTDDQLDKMRAWCAVYGIRIASEYVEKDQPGRVPLAKRKGLRLAVEDVESGDANVIVTAYFDRFVRSVMTRLEVLTRVEAKGGIVLPLDTGKTSNATPIDKLMGTQMAAQHEFYADQTGEKLQVTKQRNIENGVPPFPRITPAYDRRPNGTLTPSKHAETIREACRMRAANPPASYATIHRFLRDRGVKISLSGVESMLSSKLLIGEIHFGDFTPNLQAGEQWGGTIIDRATFRAMHERKATRGRYSKSDRLLARLGVLVCKSCGGKMTAASSRALTGGVSQSYAYYRCPNRASGCDAPASVPAEYVENLIRDEALDLAQNIEGRATAIAELEEARVEAEEAKLRLGDSIDTLTELGLMGEPTSKKKLKELAVDRDAKVARHERLQALVSPDMVITNLAAWNLATLAQKRRLVTTTIALASVTRGRGKGRVEIVGHTTTKSVTRDLVK